MPPMSIRSGISIRAAPVPFRPWPRRAFPGMTSTGPCPPVLSPPAAADRATPDVPPSATRRGQRSRTGAGGGVPAVRRPRVVGETCHVDRWSMVKGVCETVDGPVVVKPYPRDGDPATRAGLRDLQVRYPHLRVSDSHIHDLIAASDRVVTINSAMGIVGCSPRDGCGAVSGGLAAQHGPCAPHAGQ